MPKGIDCLCEKRRFYYPNSLEKKEEGFAFNTYCEKCERIIAIIITKEDKVVTEADVPELFFNMNNMLQDNYGKFFYQKVGVDFGKKEFKG